MRPCFLPENVLYCAKIQYRRDTMSTYIQMSMFQNSFPPAVSAALSSVITRREHFAFVASEFECLHEKTDRYFAHFLELFAACGIRFEKACVVDGRMTPEEAQRAVREADVVWLSGGDTPSQFGYFKQYGLVDALKKHGGVVIGMSAGAINMAETAVCTLTCTHDRFEIYPALGLVSTSVEPHFDPENITEELLRLSEVYPLYGLCDEGMILVKRENTYFFGDIYKLDNRTVQKLSC